MQPGSDDEALPLPVTDDSILTPEERKQIPDVKKAKKANTKTVKKTTSEAAASVLPPKQRLTLSDSDLPESAENIMQEDDIIGWRAKLGKRRKSFLLAKYESVEVMKKGAREMGGHDTAKSPSW